MNFRTSILKSLLYSFSFTLLFITPLAAQDKRVLTCNEDNYVKLIVKEDSIWNTLIIDACKCLHNREYEKAKEYLNHALTIRNKGVFLDSIAREVSKIDAQIRDGFYADSTGSGSSSTVSVNSREKIFSEAEIKIFHERGIQKMRLFEAYLNKIGSKNTGSTDANKAIGSALKLFHNPEEHFVSVSSVNKQGITKFAISKYLRRILALNYDEIQVKFAEFLYISKLYLAPDGNYYGFIKFRQRFKGIKDNMVVYEDVTDKVMTIILKPYLKAQDGEYKEEYEVFLGDIEVTQTMKQ